MKKVFLTVLTVLLSYQVHAETMLCPDSIELQTANLINAERAKAGLNPLIYDVRLGAAADRLAVDMAKNCFISHTGSDGSSFTQRIYDAGYPSPSGEIAAAGYSTPEAVVAGWMSSSGHRAIILTAGNLHFGGAYAYNGNCNYRHYWNFDFGTSSGAPATVEQYCSISNPPTPPPTPPPTAPAPTISSITPNQIKAGLSTTALIAGANITQGATLALTNGSGAAPIVTVTSISNDGTLLMANITTKIQKGKKRATYWDVVVTLPDGQTARLPRAFLVSP